MAKRYFATNTSNRATVPAARQALGWEDQKGIAAQHLNDMIANLQSDYVIGTAAQVALFQANLYWNGANFINQTGGIITFSGGERLAIIGFDTLSANCSISGNNLRFMMDPGVSIDLASTYTFTVAGTGCRGNLNFSNSFPSSIIISSGTSLLDIVHDSVNAVVNTGSVIENGFIDSELNTSKNKIINGAFNINQRVVSGTVILSPGQYGHDRFKGGASGCTYTFASSGGVTTITISAGSLVQVIEGINLETGTYALSWEGTSQGKIGAGSFSNSGVTGSVTGGADLNIEFNTGTLSKIQLEEGLVATTFEKRLYGLELMLCRRYYEDSGGIQNYTTYASGAGYGVVDIQFKVKKREPFSFTSYQNDGVTVGFTTSIIAVGGTVQHTSSITAHADGVNYTFLGASSGANNLTTLWKADAEL